MTGIKSESDMVTIEVPIRGKDRSYLIMIERGLLDNVAGLIKQLNLKARCAVITNPMVGKIYGKRVINSLDAAGFNPFVIEIPDGEEHKTLAAVSSIYDRLLEERFERDSVIVALGGGVVGDVAGFAASTFLRGVDYIQIPTTLLSQVDSSIGGKTGVNHPGGKNLIGAFYQPKAVFIDPDALSTLDKRELKAGFAEVIKSAIIRDKEFFRFLEDNVEGLLNLDNSVLTAIKRSCEIKAEVVTEDEREHGIRAILNYGHTFGHALESLTGYRTFRHGEAVSIGMVMAGELSVMLGIAKKDAAQRIRGIVERFGLPQKSAGLEAGELLKFMRSDKKVKGGKFRFVLVEDIGSVVIKEVEEARIMEFLEL